MRTCKRCGNSDPSLFGKRKDGSVYCRACVSFKGEEVKPKPRKKVAAPLSIPFKLSPEQKRLSSRLIKNFVAGIDSLVYAVCGSGKTEISYGIIAFALSHGKRVAFALPRRDVVIELYWRLKEAFPKNRVVAVYGEHHDRLEGDIIVLTTHQLFRYPSYFDLIVMDEIDAFPYKGDKTLHGFFERALSKEGRSVLMSATPSASLLKEYKGKGKAILELRTRFHKKPIPLPSFIVLPRFLQKVRLLRYLSGYKKTKKPVFVFAPTIGEAESLFSFLRLFRRDGALMHSKVPDRASPIKGLKEGKIGYLVSTSVLERGVTVRDLQVLVYHADEERIYDQATLVQIAGRAGRKNDAPDGDVLFLAEKVTPAMKGAYGEIASSNAYL